MINHYFLCEASSRGSKNVCGRGRSFYSKFEWEISFKTTIPTVRTFEDQTAVYKFCQNASSWWYT